MRLSDRIYKMMQQSRKRIIETMRERNITKVDLVMTQEEFAKENGFDDVEEPEKIWLVKQESNDDGEIHFFVKVCRDKPTAVSILQEWKDALLTKHPKYVDAKPYVDGEKDPDDQMCCYEWENEDEDSFYIKVLGDDYHELLTIEEKEII